MENRPESSVTPEYAGPLSDAWAVLIEQGVPAADCGGSYDGCSYEMQHDIPNTEEVVEKILSFLSNVFNSVRIYKQD